MLGFELPLSDLTRFCTFWLTLGQDANLNICISQQLWHKCLRLLFYPPVLLYSPQMPSAFLQPYCTNPRQTACCPSWLHSRLSHRDELPGHAGLCLVTPEGAGVKADDGWHGQGLRNVVEFHHPCRRDFVNRFQCCSSFEITRSQHSLLLVLTLRILPGSRAWETLSSEGISTKYPTAINAHMQLSTTH